MRQEQYGGTEVLKVIDREEPHAGPGELRVRVAAASVNPIDCKLASSEQMSSAFGLGLPRGFGGDFAGTFDEVGDGVEGFAVGDRVFGNNFGAAIAEHIVVNPSQQPVEKTPEGLSDVLAGSLSVIAPTAVAAIGELKLAPGETVLIGGASGSVGLLATQLAVQAGARVIATASERNHEYLRGLGAEPVTYGEGLADRVRALAPNGVDAAADLNGTDTIEAAVALGVDPQRITSIAAGPNPPHGARATGSRNAPAGALADIARQVADGSLTVPVAATYPIDEIRDAVEAQKAAKQLGKIVVTA